jgi:GNAT superfamily N-acetyltransferase
VEIRRLFPGERERWLELLDGWQMADGWRGRDFFARPAGADPSYADANVWVAAEGSRLLASVQIFPRRLALDGREVPTGGIGSVFTRPERRGAGLASRLLERAVADMRSRGMELSLLFAARIPFYERLGWRSWPMRRELLRRAGEAGAEPPRAPGFTPAAFDPDRDQDDVRALHAQAAARRSGLACRDTAEWRASLALAGNPAEEFRLARDAGGALAAYLRAIRLNDTLVIAEFGEREPDALALLVDALLRPRARDALAPPQRESAAFRSYAVLPLLADPPLAAALEARGISRQPVADPTPMLRCLDAAALARRLGLAPEADAEALLRRALPPERFCYWPADRF